MIVVTGGAGFIGSHIVKALNDRGRTDVLVVDDLTDGRKSGNLSDCVISDYMDKLELMEAVRAGSIDPGQIEAILHQGACTDTTQTDGRYMMENNYTYSKHLLRFAADSGIRFVYASSGAVYGESESFVVDPCNERPVNVYGYSKLALDQHVRTLLPEASTTIVGLRYFNVYGPRETHKDRMSSMVHQLYRQITATGAGRLFEGTGGYADGEQRRDFVHVDDVVSVNLHFALSATPVSGIFNVGTGRSRSFNELARILIECLGRGRTEYIPFEQSLAGSYQSFTEADLSGLRQHYEPPFAQLEEGIPATIEAWEAGRRAV